MCSIDKFAALEFNISCVQFSSISSEYAKNVHNLVDFLLSQCLFSSRRMYSLTPVVSLHCLVMYKQIAHTLSSRNIEKNVSLVL